MRMQQCNWSPFSSNPVLAQQVEYQLVLVGFSARAARQLVMGEPVPSFADRLLFARRILSIEVENDETHWVGHDRFTRSARPNVHVATAVGHRAERLRRAGLSPRGVQECLAGLPIVGLTDRARLAAALPSILGYRSTNAFA